LYLDLIGVAESSSRIADWDKVEVKVNERVNLNVAVKLNAEVDVEVMDNAHDPQRWLGSSLFDTT
jgi:hypothetical protein